MAGVAAVAAVTITAALVLGDGGSPKGGGPYVLLTYEVAPLDGQTEVQARDLAIAGIRQRLDDRALDVPSVIFVGPSRFRVEFGTEGVDVDQVIELIQRSAVLGIHFVDDGNAAMHGMYEAVVAEDPPGIYPLFDSWSGPDGDHRDEWLWSEDRAALEAWLRARPAAEQPAADRRIALERLDEKGLKGQLKWRTYVIETAPIITGADVATSGVTYDTNTLRPEVELDLDADGRVRFADATTTHVGHKLAIVLDGRVVSAPIVQGAIPGGRIRVTMGGSDPDAQEREAADLVAVLRAGSIPPLLLVDRRDVGPSR